MKNHILENPIHFTEQEKDEILKRFMKEFFHFPTVYEYGVGAIHINHGFASEIKSIYE